MAFNYFEFLEWLEYNSYRGPKLLLVLDILHIGRQIWAASWIKIDDAYRNGGSE